MPEFTKEEINNYILRALRMSTGDNLERCQMGFSKYSDTEMLQQHGQSGQTRKEVLDAYQRDRNLYYASVDVLEECIKSKQVGV